MIGSSMVNVDAVKPHTEDPVLDQGCLDEDGGLCNTTYNFVCGEEFVSGKESILKTLTTWENNNKFKLVESHVGKLYVQGTGFNDPIGFIDDTVTTQGFLDAEKGATVVKSKMSVQCVNGEKDTIETTVTITHPSK